MAALAPPVAATRSAIRDCLRHHLPSQAPGDLVLVACSGGADSIALARAAAFVVPREGLRVGLVTIDHGLQPGSRDRAEQLVKWAAVANFSPAVAITVEVGSTGEGPEAAARDARYAALSDISEREGAAAVLLGHTRDDQAETVLLALARGASPRGLAGMPPSRLIGGIPFLRPFLTISRAETLAACAATGEAVWDDPHNHDPIYTRVRVRDAMSTLVDVLGGDVVANLARTASLIADDVTALDEMAGEALTEASAPDGSLACRELALMAPAVRTRVLRKFALNLGAPGGALAWRHIAALNALVVAWHGQGAVALPGGHHVVRRDGRLRLA